jgi:hypothetical protein
VNANIAAQMKIRIHELSENQMLIVNEGDREFVMGLALLMDMDEGIDVQHAPRVAKIYSEVMSYSFNNG